MGGKVKIKEVEDGLEGAPKWITTFVDMISLLVTFFILLFTFSSIQDAEEFTYPQNILGSRGVLERKGGRAFEAPKNDIMQAMDIARGGAVPHSRPPDKLPENLEEMGQRLTEEHIEFDANDVKDGLRITFDRRAAFAPGSTQVSPVLRKSLVEMARTMENYGHLILIEGHTDSAFQPTPTYPTAESLSIARASAAAEVMLESSDLSPLMLQLAGIGSSRPLGGKPGGSASERTENRRIEVVILSMDEHRATKIEEDLDGK